MRDLEEFSKLIEYCGDSLFSAVFGVTHSRKQAVETICRASEKYLENGRKLDSVNAKYSLLLKYCGKILRKEIKAANSTEHLTTEEKENIITAARIYISVGGKAKKRKAIIIVGLIFAAVIVAIVIYEYNYIQSDEYQEAFGDWYEHETQFRQEYGWGH